MMCFICIIIIIIIISSSSSGSGSSGSSIIIMGIVISDVGRQHVDLGLKLLDLLVGLLDGVGLVIRLALLCVLYMLLWW